MRSVVDRNVVRRPMTVIAFITFGVQETVPLEKLTVPQVAINPPPPFPLYGTRKFITVFTTARHLY